ncbi:uncharacterized protein LOC132945376 [Metopolophium dirhodum]|uniref:uncharacterized protein LOC132945376 n=1 Tax=Metopolophium dirhodum TaxID=44670 RepID=UPI002990719E|nr:uncharacterized protein LOC132945376 [Metopolophium dirhodum]XP_060871083.1 uncharacterized protein LOC132945376 [Metopolophium dirhodum]
MQWSTGAYLCAVLLLQLHGPAVDASFWDFFNFSSMVTQKWSTMQANDDDNVVRQTENYFLLQFPPRVLKTNLASEMAAGKRSEDDMLVVGHTMGKEEHRLTRCTGTVVGLVADAEHTEGNAVIRLTPDINEYPAKKSVGEHFDAIKG